MRTYIRAVILVLTCAAFGTAQQIDWSKKALQSERSRTYDALHYRIAIRLDLDRKSFEGDTTVSLTSLRDGLETCVLDAEEFRVTKVVSDYGEPLQFEQTEKELRVRMPLPLKLGETRSFTCSYQGRDPKIGLRFMAESANNPKLVFSDSFPDHVHHWFPCYDYPNDKVTNEIIATVKSSLKVAANGRLVSVSEDKPAGTVTYHWSQELPHSTYLIFLAAAPYVVVHDSYKALPVNYWVYPQDEKKAMPTYGKTPKMIEFFFEALAAGAQNDPFWAVRRSAIESLGKLPDPRVQTTLKKTCLDAHSSVRTASLAALGDAKDRGLIEFYKERFAKDESQLVKAETLRALGKTGDPSVIPFLEKSATVPSYRDMIRNAAMQALRQVGS